MSSNLKDILSTFLVLGILIPIIYLLSLQTNEPLLLGLMILIIIPTVMSMINGAPYVPTPFKRAEQMVKLAKLKKGDRVYDLGCGDGRFVYIAANQYGAKATGFELSPIVYLLAVVRKLLWKSKAKIKFANFKTQNISDADVIFCYLLPDTLRNIQKNLDLKIKPGTKIVSYAFKIPDWKLIQTEEKVKDKNYAPIWIYQK
jgi:SAM-dependent methyltransferase